MTPALSDLSHTATRSRRGRTSSRHPLGIGLAVALTAPLALAAAPPASAVAPAVDTSTSTTALAGTASTTSTTSTTSAARESRDRPRPVGHRLPKVATMSGSGGAVASVDPVASQVGIDVLRRGGNAADAAIATAAALGVVEPYANGIGGGGFFVYYDAKRGKISTIDGRETAPQGLTEKGFLKPDGTPMDFDTVVNSGLSVGVPGTPATWKAALDRWGSRSYSAMLEPAQRIAERGFVVDDSFSEATAENAERFAKFPATAKVFLPGGKPVVPGSVLRQPDLARAYAQLRRHGPDALYRGPIGKAIVATVNAPQTTPGVSVPSGSMTSADLASYRALSKAPIRSTYRGFEVFGMPVPSSGGIALAEALHLIEAYEKRTGGTLKGATEAPYLHAFAEASATAFADRNRWVGDIPGVLVAQLTNRAFAAERACGFDPAKAQARPPSPSDHRTARTARAPPR